MLVMRALSHAYPFRPLVKAAVDQTSTRSTTTKPLTIKPPPLPAINGVAGSGSLLHREPIQSIRQAIEAALREGGIKADCSDLFSHLKIELPTAQLAAASAVLVDLHLI